MSRAMHGGRLRHLGRGCGPSAREPIEDLLCRADTVEHGQQRPADRREAADDDRSGDVDPELHRVRPSARPSAALA